MQRRLEWWREMQRSLAAARGHRINGKDTFSRTETNRSYCLSVRFLSGHIFQFHTSYNRAVDLGIHLRSWRIEAPIVQACSDFMFGCLLPLHEVTPLDPACLAWTDEMLLRCRNDDSSQKSRIWIGAASSMPDARLDNG